MKTKAEFLATRIDELGLTVRTKTCCKNDNIGIVAELVIQTEAELLKIPNFGRKALNEVRGILTHMGLHLGMTPDQVAMYMAGGREQSNTAYVVCENITGDEHGPDRIQYYSNVPPRPEDPLPNISTTLDEAVRSLPIALNIYQRLIERGKSGITIRPVVLGDPLAESDIVRIQRQNLIKSKGLTPEDLRLLGVSLSEKV